MIMMTKRLNGLFFLCVLFFLWIAAAIVLFLVPRHVPVAQTLCHQVTKMSLLFFDKNSKEYTLGARRAFQVAHGSPFFNVEQPWVRTTIYHKKVFLSADLGLLNQKKRQAYLCHHVTLNWDDGAHVITTQKALVDEKKKTIVGTTPVQGKGVYGDFKGCGFTFNKNTLYLRGPASVRIKSYSRND